MRSVPAPPDAGEPIERVHVARERREGRAEVPLGRRELAEAEVQLAELDVRPRGRLGAPRGGVEREPHCRDRRARSAEQLARVRDARVRGEAGLSGGEGVEGGERVAVAAQLDEGVAEEPEVRGIAGASARARRASASARRKSWRESARAARPLVAPGWRRARANARRSAACERA